MPSFLRSLNFDEMLKNSPIEPIIINDLPNRSEKDREYFNYLIRNTYTSDMVTALPQCQCGETKGEHLVGAICEYCEQPVRQSIERDILPSLWFRKPIGIKKLISPYFLILLQMQFKKRGLNIIQWLMDRNIPLPPKYPAVVDKIIAAKIPRGYNNFVEHFDEIMEFLFASNDFKKNNFVYTVVSGMLGEEFKKEDPLKIMLRDFRDNVFCDYIPLPNKLFIVLEQTNIGTFVENSIFDIQNVLNTMLSIDKDHYDTRLYTLENRTARILHLLSNYYYQYVITRYRPKKGLPRKHLYAGRGNHSFRAVITSHEEITDHDEIWIPWPIAVSVFWLHLMNYLLRPGHPLGNMTHNQATEFLLTHIEKYHPLLDKLFDKLITESPTGSIVCMQNRNLKWFPSAVMLSTKSRELLERPKAA